MFAFASLQNQELPFVNFYFFAASVHDSGVRPKNIVRTTLIKATASQLTYVLSGLF